MPSTSACGERRAGPQAGQHQLRRGGRRARRGRAGALDAAPGGTHAGQRLVIYGASGSLGTAAVQLAHEMGAHVTGVCSTGHVELVRSLGADEVVDYTQDDFRKYGPFDAIIDAVGKYSFRKGRVALRPGGIYVGTDLGQDGLATLAMAVTTRFRGDKRLKMAIGRRSRPDVEHMKALIEARKFHPVVDRIYPMEQAVEAHRYVEGWHKTGNVVLAMGDDDTGGTGNVARSRNAPSVRHGLHRGLVQHGSAPGGRALRSRWLAGDQRWRTGGGS